MPWSIRREVGEGGQSDYENQENKREREEKLGPGS
jgi:hypothetical protein